MLVSSFSTHILHHSQEQAFRPVPQRVNFLVEQARKPVHKKLIENGATSQFQPICYFGLIEPFQGGTLRCYAGYSSTTLNPCILKELDGDLPLGGGFLDCRFLAIIVGKTRP